MFLFANRLSGSRKASRFLEPHVPKEFETKLPSKRTACVRIFDMIDKAQCMEAASLIVAVQKLGK